MTLRTKSLLYLAGTALLLLSLVYIGDRIAANWPSIRQAKVQHVSWLFAAFLIYAVSHVSTSLSWPLAVRQLGTHIGMRDAFQIGLITQVGKYLPGNVAHYVGRGALATQFGIPLKSSGISTVIEFGSAILAMTAVASIGLLFDTRLLALLPGLSVSSAMIAIALASSLAAGVIWLVRAGTDVRMLLGPFFCLAISAALSGLSLFATAQAFGFGAMPATIAVSAFSIAWVIGFLVPGAPAGLGIREAILLTLLTPIIGGGGAIVVTVTHRVMTALADAAAALVGYVWLAVGSRPKK